MFAARRARDAAASIEVVAPNSATNRLQGCIMKQVSEMTARCTAFFLQVLPFSLIVETAVDPAGH